MRCWWKKGACYFTWLCGFLLNSFLQKLLAKEIMQYFFFIFSQNGVVACVKVFSSFTKLVDFVWSIEKKITIRQKSFWSSSLAVLNSYISTYRFLLVIFDPHPSPLNPIFTFSEIMKFLIPLWNSTTDLKVNRKWINVQRYRSDARFACYQLLAICYWK